VLDHDPSSSEFGLRLKDFGSKPSFVLELGRISIPLELVGLRIQNHRHSISYRCFIFTYDLVAIHWLIREIGQREGGVNLQEVEFGLFFARLEDCPPWHDSASCSSCSSCVLERFRFDPSGQLFLAERGFADRPPGCRGPSTRHELVADRRGQGADHLFSGCSTGGLVGFFGPSTKTSRTVRHLHADRPPDHHRQSAWCFADLLSPLLLESCFLLGLFGACSYGW
jgi:hypothetical protein